MSQLNPSQGRVLTKIIDEAQKQGVPPDLAGAIGWKESLLGERTTDPYGVSVGVFQLKRIVLAQVKEIGAIGSGVNFSDLSNDNMNIKVGISYFKYIMNKYPSWPMDTVLSAWNQGETAVKRVWNNSSGSLSTFFRKLVEAGLTRAVNFVSKVKVALLDIQDAIQTRIQKAGIYYDEEEAADRFMYFTDMTDLRPESELVDEGIDFDFGNFFGLSFTGTGRGGIWDEVVFDPGIGLPGGNIGWESLIWQVPQGTDEAPPGEEQTGGTSWTSLALGALGILMLWQLMGTGGDYAGPRKTS